MPNACKNINSLLSEQINERAREKFSTFNIPHTEIRRNAFQHTLHTNQIGQYLRCNAIW